MSINFFYNDELIHQEEENYFPYEVYGEVNNKRLGIELPDDYNVVFPRKEGTIDVYIIGALTPTGRTAIVGRWYGVNEKSSFDYGNQIKRWHDINGEVYSPNQVKVAWEGVIMTPEELAAKFGY